MERREFIRSLGGAVIVHALPGPIGSEIQIPEEFLVPVAPKDTEHNTLVECAAIVAEALNQDWNDPSANERFPWQKQNPTAVPRGWCIVGYDGKPVADIFRKPVNPSTGFGAAETKFSFAVLMPNNFTLVNITKDNDAQGDSGYDAVALYDAQARHLLVVSKGADDNSTPDKAAAIQGGGSQIKAAQQFLQKTLDKLPSRPQKIVFAGHSLGGVAAVAQVAIVAKMTPPIPFSVITFDSIGDGKFIQDHHISADVVHAIQPHHLAFTGEKKPPVFFQHKTAGTIIPTGCGHEMPNYTAYIMDMVKNLQPSRGR